MGISKLRRILEVSLESFQTTERGKESKSKRRFCCVTVGPGKQ